MKLRLYDIRMVQEIVFHFPKSWGPYVVLRLEVLSPEVSSDLGTFQCKQRPSGPELTTRLQGKFYNVIQCGRT
jgi:hypothetical protein